jgi:hypothetical protein
VRELRIPIGVLAVDLFTVFGQVMRQIPQVRGCFDLVRPLLCFRDDLMKFPLQSGVESCAGNGLFRLRPLRFIRLGISVLGRRGLLRFPSSLAASLAGVPSLQLRWPPSPGQIPEVSLLLGIHSEVPPLPIRSTTAQGPWRIWIWSSSKPTSSDLRKPEPNSLANIA